MALVHDMGTHGRRRRLAVGACHTKSLMLAGQCTQYLSSLLDLKTISAEIFHFLMVFRNSWRIDYKTRIGPATGMRYFVDIFLIMDECSFLFQLTSQDTWRLVIASYDHSTMNEVAYEGTHTNAAGPNKVY